MKLFEQTGTIILIEGLRNPGDKLTTRLEIESYCDWFTVVGDVRSGLFEERKKFHEAVKHDQTEELRTHEAPLVPIDVQLQVNGEKDFSPLYCCGVGLQQVTKIYAAWDADAAASKSEPGLLALGHRFADHHLSRTQTTARARDDLSS